MKKILVVLVLVFFIVGCKSASEGYVEAINASLELIIPAHVSYIKADEKLSDLDKDVRSKAATETLLLSRKAVEGKEGK